MLPDELPLARRPHFDFQSGNIYCIDTSSAERAKEYHKLIEKWNGILPTQQEFDELTRWLSLITEPKVLIDVGTVVMHAWKKGETIEDVKEALRRTRIKLPWYRSIFQYFS